MPSSSPISGVNDFVVRFANVNGSGSASANELFARAILRMGIPVAPRNIFPSNIQGLPTWYEVRISEAGHLGARGGTDLLVAMNPQTWDMDVKVVEQLIGEQFKSKEKLIGANVHALHLGRNWALMNLACPIGLRLRSATAVGDRIFIEGNSAAALGAVYGGATVCAWYPITPSSSLAEAFTRHCQKLRVDPETKKNRFAVIQAEDELASIGMVVGAGWNGARAFTSTS